MGRKRHTKKDVWKDIVIEDETKCWIWQGNTDRDGYGIKTIGRKQYRVSRVVYELMNSDVTLTIDKFVCHTCDNPLCCNPKHLFLGTNNDNTQDKIKKGRARYLSGSDNPMAKLTQEQVEEIRRRYNNEKITQEALAQEYGVNNANIGCIVNNRSWKPLDGYAGVTKSADLRHQTLTQEQVEEIRRRYSEEKTSTHKLGCEYGVHGTTIWRIVKSINEKQTPDSWGKKK